MLSIQTDINSLKIRNYLSDVTDRLNTCTKKLSTGQKLNSASDDAAGLYLSSGLQTRINSLNIGVNASQTGVSILNIAEGSITNMQQSFQRIRDLAVQAASGYYTTDARQAMQDEVNALVDQINMEKDSCNFNGKELLAASASDDTTQTPTPTEGFHQLTIDDFENISSDTLDGVEFRTGERNGQTYHFIENANQFITTTHGYDDDFAEYRFDGTNFVLLNDIDMSIATQWKGDGTGYFTIDGNGHKVMNYSSDSTIFDHNYGTIKNLGFENFNINYGSSNPSGILCRNNSGTIDNCRVQNSTLVGCDNHHNIFSFSNFGTISNSYSRNIYIYDSSGDPWGIDHIKYNSGIVKNCYAINTEVITSGVSYEGYSFCPSPINCYQDFESDSTYKETAWFASQEAATTLGNAFEYIDGNDHPTLKWENPDPPTPPSPSGGEKMRIQVGYNDSADSYIELDLGFDLGTISIDLMSETSAANAITTIDNYLKLLNDKQSLIGASYNRLESVSQSNAVAVENISASKSTIVDADIAKENSNYIKNQILQSAATSLLAQSSNINSQIILGLLNNI